MSIALRLEQSPRLRERDRACFLCGFESPWARAYRVLEYDLDLDVSGLVLLCDWCASGYIGAVYFIREPPDGPVKIGYAREPRERLATLQCGNPRELMIERVLAGPAELERRVHDRFSEHRLRAEWFEWAPVRDWLEGPFPTELFSVEQEAVA